MICWENFLKDIIDGEISIVVARGDVTSSEGLKTKLALSKTVLWLKV